MRSTIAAILVFCFLSLYGSPTCRAVEIADCGSQVGKFTLVNLKGCDMTKSVCDLVRNTNASIEIDFTLDKDVSSVVAIVHGVIMDIPIPFPLPGANACANPDSGLTCPLTQGGPYHYHTTLPVLKSYPKLSVMVKWQLVDEKNENIVCVLLPARIV